MLAIVVSVGSVGLRSRFDGMAALFHEGVLGHVWEMVRACLRYPFATRLLPRRVPRVC